MARLRRTDCTSPGISRRRRGRGFSYAYADGRPVTDRDTLDRIRGLAIPPAWAEVWICPWANGHIQSVGTDVAGRRQYRYHDEWRIQRDREKFERVVDFGRALPELRSVVERDLSSEGLSRERVVATVVRLLDVGLFRIGGEEYAEENETFGVASLHKEHVRIRDGVMYFSYLAKGSTEQKLQIDDAGACEVVATLRRRRNGGPNLFAYKQSRRWTDLHSNEVNSYIKASAGEEFSAKDFRTWSATVLAAAALADAASADAALGEAAPGDGSGRAGRGSRAGQRRAIAAAVAVAAGQLGNTPAVCRSSYVDPRIIDRFECGETIRDHLPTMNGRSRFGGVEVSRPIEEAVIDLLDGSSH